MNFKMKISKRLQMRNNTHFTSHSAKFQLFTTVFDEDLSFPGCDVSVEYKVRDFKLSPRRK